jgi:hypothetical protein
VIQPTDYRVSFTRTAHYNALGRGAVRPIMPQPIPDWVSFDADETEGLDLLGLRAPVQAIGNELFNGVTTVTPKLRYLSLISWIIWRYSQARLPDAWTPFEQFASAQEAAVVIANLMHDRSIINMVGANAGRTRLDENKKNLELSKLVQNIAFNIYVSSSRDLNITHQTESGFNGITKDRGLPLARAFDGVISKCSYGNHLSKNPKLDKIPRSDLEELSKVISFDRIPADEKTILIDALMPSSPEKEEWHRLETYALLLWLTGEKAAEVGEDDVFEAALEPPLAIPASLRPILDGWLKYIIRDVLAVTHEAVFESIMQQVDVQSAARGGPALAADVVASLLTDTEEYNEALREFDLLKKRESVEALTFKQLRQRVVAGCGGQESYSNGLKRWRGGLSEIDLYDAALESTIRSAVLLPVTWCLAAHRVSPVTAETSKDILSIGGIFQIGLGDVVIPKVEEFEREDRNILDVMAALITRTAQQHLRVAWTRLAPPEGKDVSVLVADVETWSRNEDHGFQAGRTDSRLRVAISWLRQLGLLDEDGLTSAGEHALKRCLTTLGVRRD